MHQSFLTQIKAKRLEKKFSQYYMAACLEITQGYYNKLENGKNKMTAKTMFEIIEILDINLTELYDSYKNNKSA